MSTTHRIFYDNSSQLSGIEDESVDEDVSILRDNIIKKVNDGAMALDTATDFLFNTIK